MRAFICLISFGVLLHLVSCDVLTNIDSNNKNVKSAQIVQSNNYQNPQGYEYSGSYSTVAPQFRAQYTGPSASKTSYEPYPSGQVNM